MENPKLFISYSWTSQQHEQEVLSLATQLVESGVNVIIDKWELKEGNDSIAFMEKMVVDPEIKKVIMICDRMYAEKSDKKKSGVGTESQIISNEVYSKVDQNKFVAVIVEKNEDGKPFLPTYYKSRIYIDLENDETYTENFEKLLRWIYDKPWYKKPELGKKPNFLDDENIILLGTSASFNRAIDSIKNSRQNSLGLVTEYLDLFSKSMEKIRINDNSGEFDEKIIQSIQDFLPYRNEYVQLLSTICQYHVSIEMVNSIHKFLESLIHYLDKPAEVSSWKEWDFDNFKFVIHELFVYTISIFLKYEKFNFAGKLLKMQYFIPGNSDYGRNEMVDFITFRVYLRSLEYRNQRLKLNRVSLHADLLKQRTQGVSIEFRHLLQTDFILFLHSMLHGDEKYFNWWPTTLVYLGSFQTVFEIFARSVSNEYFENIKILLNINSHSELKTLLTRFQNREIELPRWNFHTLNPAALIGIEKICTKP